MRRSAFFYLLVFYFGSQRVHAVLPMGYYHCIRAMENAPSVIEADKYIAGFIAFGTKMIADMEKAYSDAEIICNSERTMSPEKICDLEKILIRQFEIIQEKKRSLENDLLILNDRLYSPIEENFKLAVSNVALWYNLPAIHDSCGGEFIIPADALDLTAAVRSEFICLEKERTGLE